MAMHTQAPAYTPVLTHKGTLGAWQRQGQVGLPSEGRAAESTSCGQRILNSNLEQEARHSPFTEHQAMFVPLPPCFCL